MKIITVRFADNTGMGTQIKGEAILDEVEGTLVVLSEEGLKTTFNWSNIVYFTEAEVDTDEPSKVLKKGQASGFFS